MVREMLLAIDTSTRWGGVALCSDKRVDATLCWYSIRHHTAELMPAVEYILTRAKIGPASLEGIGVGLGPGAFSALRVGLSAAKGLALPIGIPIVGVGTLEMEAYPYATTRLPICSVLDASRGEVATATFQETEGGWRKLYQERVCTPQTLVESISRPTLCCGEGVPPIAEYLRETLGENAVMVSFHSSAPRLLALAVLAQDRIHTADPDNLVSLEPTYLRSPSIGQPKTPQRVKH